VLRHGTPSRVKLTVGDRTRCIFTQVLAYNEPDTDDDRTL
jgi:hypothetical protein